MNGRHYHRNKIELYKDPLEINLFESGNIDIALPPNPDTKLFLVIAFAETIYLKGTTVTVPQIALDNGTDGEAISGTSTLTSAALGRYFPLTNTTQPYVVTGGDKLRLRKVVVGQGQATATRARADGIATITTGASHGFAVGDEVVLSDVGGTGYNGTVIVLTVPSATSFTYASPGDDENSTADTDGHVGAHKIRLYVETLYW